MTILYSSDFEGGTHLAVLSAFTVIEGAAFIQLGPSFAPAPPARGTFRYGTASNGDRNYWNGDTALTNQAVRYATKVQSGSYIGVSLRTNVATKSGYLAYCEWNGTHLRGSISERDNAGQIAIVQSGYDVAYAAGQTLHYEFRAVETGMELRLWVNAAARPETPTVSYTDSTYTSGAVSLINVFGAGAYATVDDLVITDGAGGEDHFYDGSDTTAPSLTSPVGTATGTTTATVGATTDEANGTLYAVVSPSATQPSAAQLQAGQTHTGAAAPWSGNQAVSSTGAKTFGATGLTASTPYYAHVQHRDAAGNNSAIVTSTAFTTSAAGDTTPPVLSSPVGGATGTSTATVGATTNEGNGTLYSVVTLSATPPSAAQIMAGQTHTGAAAPWAGSIVVSSTGAKTLSATGLTASTPYYAHEMHRDAAGNNSNVVTSGSFTTGALATLNFQAAGMEFGRRTGLAIDTFALDAVSNYRFTVHADGLVLGAALITSGVVTTDSGGMLPNYSNGSLASGVTYRVVAIRQADGEPATFRLVAA